MSTIFFSWAVASFVVGFFLFYCQWTLSGFYFNEKNTHTHTHSKRRSIINVIFRRLLFLRNRRGGNGDPTYSLFFLPRLHGALVLLELVAPVRVHAVIVLRPGGRRAPMRVHGQVERTQQRAGQLTVVTATVLFGRAYYDHTALNGSYVFFHSAVKKKKKN